MCFSIAQRLVEFTVLVFMSPHIYNCKFATNTASSANRTAMVTVNCVAAVLCIKSLAAAACILKQADHAWYGMKEETKLGRQNNWCWRLPLNKKSICFSLIKIGEIQRLWTYVYANGRYGWQNQKKKGCSHKEMLYIAYLQLFLVATILIKFNYDTNRKRIRYW